MLSLTGRLADGWYPTLKMSAAEYREKLQQIRPLVDAGARHIILWNVGPLATGVTGVDVIRLALLIRRLRKLPLLATGKH